MHVTFEAVIGLEVHCQLATETKAFSSESAAFEPEPNTHVRPLTLGHPGTLPVFNKRAVEFTLKMGLATHSNISRTSVFARKHYFYPDLPKGYQISQFDRPICSGGYVEIPTNDNGTEFRRIRLTRIHMEEDAGKSIHDAHSNASLLDYNRTGVPLIEIVSEPDLRTPREAYDYMRKIRQLVRYLEICDGNMEEGSVRCDANVSVRKRGETELGPKTEIKNLNSFRFLEKALAYEIDRQARVVSAGREVVHETRLWDDSAGETRPMRSKEEAHDYRYFPDPDLPPVIVSESLLERMRSEMPGLPDERLRRYVKEWHLPRYDAGVLTAEREIADYFESCVHHILTEGPDEFLDDILNESLNKTESEEPDLASYLIAKAVSNLMMTHVLRTLREQSIEIEDFPIDAGRLSGLVRLRLQDRVSSTGAQEIYEAMLTDGGAAEIVAESRNLLQVKDTGSLRPYIVQVIEQHPEKVEQYLKGKKGLIGFFIGRVMHSYPGSPDPRQVRTLLEEMLAAPK